MGLDATQRRLLGVVAEREPVGDEAIAAELRRGDDPVRADEVRALTAELQRQALLEQPESAPDRWQLTEEGRASLRA